MFDNKNIFILGMARSGYEAAKILSKNNSIIINDKNEEQDENHIKELKKLGIKVILGNHPDDLFNKSIDILIKNPGIKDDHKYVAMAKKMNIPIINELELAYLLMPKDVTIIGITGSNGKTTTTTLIYEMLTKENENVHLAGNIGFPLSGFVKNIKKGDIVVVEVSVQQLLNLDKFKTNISVLTNLSEAHLDHVGSYENYKKLKKKIFNHHSKDDIAILNSDDTDVLKIALDIKSNKKYFSRFKEENCNLKDGKIYYDGDFIIDIKDISLRGNHNYENIMAAIIVSKIFNISNENIIRTLKEFKGVEHRIEFVKEINRRKIYNDSKSTNILATKTALLSFKERIILIVGGLDREQSFLDLKENLDHVKYIIAYGENKLKIEREMLSLGKNCFVLDNLEQATKKAYSISEEGDTILLSPGSASWDQFKDYEERGKQFKKYIDNIV